MSLGLNMLTKLTTGDNISLENIDGLTGCRELKEISFEGCKIKHVDGLRGCTGLRKAAFDYCQFLDNIKGLEDLAELEELEMGTASHLKIYQPLLHALT